MAGLRAAESPHGVRTAIGAGRSIFVEGVFASLRFMHEQAFGGTRPDQARVMLIW
jgi:hypothetical protein